MFRPFVSGIVLCLFFSAPTLTSAVSASDFKADAFQRGAEQTFLTYPEWFLVFSPAEYAKYIQKKPPHDFPFLGHMDQFWESYALMTEQTRNFPYNNEYHIMIKTIGWSTEIEYWVKYLYGNSFGRLSWWITGKRTIQDDYIAEVAQLYVDAIYIRPWYEFDFFSYIPAVWRSLGNQLSIRGIERAVSFSMEYTVKGVYAKVIAFVAVSSYEQPSIYTAVKTKQELDLEGVNSLRECEVIQINKKEYLFKRYQEFTDCFVALERQGSTAQLESVVGNERSILLTLVGKRVIQNPLWRNIGSFPILTIPDESRELVIVDVQNLFKALALARKEHITVEHIFDF